MIILGIDPGLATMGWGVIESDGRQNRLVQYGTLGTPAGEAMPIRLRTIFHGVEQLIHTYQPDEIAFEELFFARNVTTALSVSRTTVTRAYAELRDFPANVRVSRVIYPISQITWSKVQQ